MVAGLAGLGALGLGVGTFSPAMPGIILAVTPASETSSAMSFNQVVRSVGFSAGSAASGFILSAYTPHGQAFPASGGYSAAAWAGVAAMAVTIIVITGLARAQRAGVAGAVPAGPGETGHAGGK